MAETAYKMEPIFTKEQVTNMVLPEVKANIKDQFDKAEEIERRYEGVITDPEDEHQVKRHLMTVEHLREWEAKLDEAQQRKNRVREGLELYSRPSNGHHQPTGDPSAGQQLSPGDQFVRSAEYVQLRKSGRFINLLGQ